MSNDGQRKSSIQQKRNSCGHKKVLEPQQVFIENLADIASALKKILKIFGIFGYKLKDAQEVIIDAFTNYDEIYHRIEMIPKKRIRKANLMHGLGRKCSMNLMEAQITYSVVKRVFKAYYYGTDKFGIPDPSLDAQQVHTRECLWVHAAKRTAQVFAEYEGMFFSTQKKYEELLKRVYMTLNHRFKKRACGLMKELPNSETEEKEDSLSVVLSEIIRNPCCCTTTSENYQSLEPSSQCGKMRVQSGLGNVLACQLCKCSPLTYDCDIDLTSSIRNVECSQGPFVCRWLPVGGEEIVWDPCFTRPDKDVCTDDHEKVSSPVSEMTFNENVGEEVSGLDDEEVEVESSGQQMDGDSYICQPAIPNSESIMLKEKIIVKKKFQWGQNEMAEIKQRPAVTECICAENQNRICAKNDEDGEIISKYNDVSEGIISKFTYACEGVLDDQATDFKSRIESKSSMLSGLRKEIL